MPEAVTPPNPDQTDSGRHGNPPQSIPDPTLMTIDALRREIAMLESLLDARIDANEELTQQRFHRIDKAMETEEDARREQKADTKDAVNAALSSQKEVTEKMETSISDQIGSLRANFETSHRALQSGINDLKDRVTILESVKQGVHQQKEERREATAGQIAAIGAGVTFVMLILAIIGVFATTAS